MRKIAAILLVSVLLMPDCAVHNNETGVGKFGPVYKSNIQRKLDSQHYTETKASLARGRISGAESIAKDDAVHSCVTQGKKTQVVKLKTEGVGLRGIARLIFKCGEWEYLLVSVKHAHSGCA